MNMNYRQFSLILSLLFIIFTLSACGNLLNEEAFTSSTGIQDPGQIKDVNTFFNKEYSTSAAINIQTKYDEFIISGSPIDETNIENIWIASIDMSGKILFETTIKTGNHGRIAAQLTDKDKNFVFICNQFNPATYMSDILIFKISPDKTIQWQKILGSSTSLFALSASILSDGTIAITGQRETPSASTYEPVLIKINPINNSISTLKINFMVTSVYNNIYPVPVRIICDPDDNLTIAGFYVTSNLKSRITVIKINSEGNVTSKYILYESTKNLSIVDLLYQNPTYDILLLCKSDTLHGRDEGFTLLKIFKDSSIKFERDYFIDGFKISDNLITGGEGDFTVGGYMTNSASDCSVSLIRFNYSGNIINYQTIENEISEINRIAFSPFEKTDSLSYIYINKKISDYKDSGLTARKFIPGKTFINSAGLKNILKTLNLTEEPIYPVEINDLVVTTEISNDITFKPSAELNIVWE